MNNNLRKPLPLLNEEDRKNTFNEVSLGYSYKIMKEEASRCMQCTLAPCTKGCPVGVKIPDFINALTEDNLAEAVRIIKLTNSLPAICGRVCPQEAQCEKLCVRKTRLGGSVSVGALERFVGDYALQSEYEIKTKPKTGHKVAVVGSGPAGLTLAGDLIAEGIDVTIFEAFHKSGGVLTYGIPEFRLPKDSVVQKEINTLLKAGVKIELNTFVGKTVMLEELREEYDAVFIGTGAGLPVFMNIKGENLNGVLSANEFLTRINLMKAYLPNSITPVYCGNNVAVVGAGNVAMDAARTAKRMGAEKVYIIYRRSRDEMPARKEEIEHALEEGVELMLQTNPIEILGDNIVDGIMCLKTELGEPDASGRRRSKDIVGSEFILDVDEVIVSIGTKPNPMMAKTWSGIEFNEKGLIVVNEKTNETNIPMVYAGGDVVTGAATVILAMGAGKKAGKDIIKKLLNN